MSTRVPTQNWRGQPVGTKLVYRALPNARLASATLANALDIGKCCRSENGARKCTVNRVPPEFLELGSLQGDAS